METSQATIEKEEGRDLQKVQIAGKPIKKSGLNPEWQRAIPAPPPDLMCPSKNTV